jgi:hypothetical protein
MQKVLTEMNVQLSNVLSDVSGMSGMKILRNVLDYPKRGWGKCAIGWIGPVKRRRRKPQRSRYPRLVPSAVKPTASFE